MPFDSGEKGISIEEGVPFSNSLMSKALNLFIFLKEREIRSWQKHRERERERERT
jgi:hypothetical protein